MHEVKKSRGALGATRMQLLYYLYYLKHEKSIETTGEINFPKERRNGDGDTDARGRIRDDDFLNSTADNTRPTHAPYNCGADTLV